MVHSFGGNWTEDKLDVMRRYFSSYALALKNTNFKKLYVDAFAGTGERKDSNSSIACSTLLFAEDGADVAAVKDGSARIALGIDPPFDQYIFIDQATKHMSALQNLRAEFPARDIDLQQGDANDKITAICKTTNWRRTRAAVFLDPYGMQLNWTTLEVLAQTKAVDVALLFPTGPLNRMLTRSGEIPLEWQKRIDDHLGPCNWRKACYNTQPSSDLFGHGMRTSKSIDVPGLQKFVADRLRSIFPAVCEQTLSLENSKGSTLYHLFIICANPSEKAVKIAMRIARSAIKPGTQKPKSDGLF